MRGTALFVAGLLIGLAAHVAIAQSGAAQNRTTQSGSNGIEM